ncbi:unnamed protein product [Auanema sp. JU1783]|nr:unnamed protein product [Auanema sp. JU1783]
MSSEDLAKVVASNIGVIKQTIEDAVSSSPLTNHCNLVAVSKTKPVELIEACIEGGQWDFGENYVNELEEKSQSLHEKFPSIRWHFIGQVQSNKIPKICNSPGLYAVHTLESEKHCLAFNKEFVKKNQELNVLVQVNTSKEEQKGGLLADDAVKLAHFIRESCSNLKFLGFMTIGSFDNSHAIPNPDFDELFKVRSQFSLQSGVAEEKIELSMGMSDDYVQAIQQGSTVVRVGSKIFGARIYKN